jgi:hypothetical protein
LRLFPVKKKLILLLNKVVQFFDNGDLLIPGNQETRRKSNNTR